MFVVFFPQIEMAFIVDFWNQSTEKYIVTESLNSNSSFVFPSEQMKHERVRDDARISHENGMRCVSQTH